MIFSPNTWTCFLYRNSFLELVGGDLVQIALLTAQISLLLFLCTIKKTVDGFLKFPGSVLLWHFYLDLLFPVSCLSITCSILFSFPALTLKCRLYPGRQPQVPDSSDLRGPDCSRPVCLIVNCLHLVQEWF